MIYKEEGFVIATREILGDDRIIILYLRGLGMVSVVAKGVKKITSRKSPNLELLNICNYSIAKGKNLDILIEVRLIDSFTNVKEANGGLGLIFYIAEVLQKIVEGEDEDIYLLTLNLLKFFDKNDKFSSKVLISFFNIKVLLFSGTLPDFYTCGKCQEKFIVEEEKVYSAGAFYHKKCSKGIDISNNLFKLFRFFERKELEDIVKLKIENGLIKEIFSISVNMVEYSISSTLKSSRFINEK